MARECIKTGGEKYGSRAEEKQSPGKGCWGEKEFHSF
jgi:hypothetical protein